MKHRFIFAFICLAAFSCQPAVKEEEPVTDTIARSGISADTVAAPLIADSAEYCADKTIAGVISAALTNVILKNDITGMASEERKFRFHAYDLDEDGKKEILVGFRGTYFCGSGGCTALLLDASGKLITRFTVTDFPLMVAPSLTGGWHDLIIESGGVNHLVKYKNGRYPGNPTLQPAYKDSIAANAPKLLQDTDSCPDFSF